MAGIPLATEAVQLPRRRLSRAEQNDAKRRLLLASALEVLTEQGYQAMTLEEVAERAGFTLCRSNIELRGLSWGYAA